MRELLRPIILCTTNVCVCDFFRFCFGIISSTSYSNLRRLYNGDHAPQSRQFFWFFRRVYTSVLLTIIFFTRIFLNNNLLLCFYDQNVEHLHFHTTERIFVKMRCPSLITDVRSVLRPCVCV